MDDAFAVCLEGLPVDVAECSWLLLLLLLHFILPRLPGTSVLHHLLLLLCTASHDHGLGSIDLHPVLCGFLLLLLLRGVLVLLPVDVLLDFLPALVVGRVLLEIDLDEVVGLPKDILVLEEGVEELLQLGLTLVEELGRLRTEGLLRREGRQPVEGRQVELFLHL